MNRSGIPLKEGTSYRLCGLHSISHSLPISHQHLPFKPLEKIQVFPVEIDSL